MCKFQQFVVLKIYILILKIYKVIKVYLDNILLMLL